MRYASRRARCIVECNLNHLYNEYSISAGSGTGGKMSEIGSMLSAHMHGKAVPICAQYFGSCFPTTRMTGKLRVIVQ